MLRTVRDDVWETPASSSTSVGSMLRTVRDDVWEFAITDQSSRKPQSGYPGP